MVDQAVLAAQKWVNDTYSGRAGYSRVDENGKTGWPTMYALTRALQLELGITATSNNFGPGTLSNLEGQYSSIGPNLNDNNSNIVKIIQSGLYCKGYGPGAISGTFGSGTAAAVSNMQENMGINADGTVTPKVFKALLTMDAYVTLEYYGGTEKIRKIQQWLNGKYLHRENFFIQPTDGVYSRGTQEALIYAIQFEEGLSDSVANGNFGPSTRSNLPTLRVGNQDGSTQFVHLLQAALCFNQYDVDFDGIFGNGTKSAVIAFQSFAMLPSDGIVGLTTWSSLLVSTGDPTRKGTALDCITEITPDRAQTLVNAGYETVGRYLTNVEGTTLNKKIQTGELETIFNAGMTVFPIYQTYGGNASYFNANQGTQDAIAAHNAAKNYGFPENTIIYFAVDYDSTDYDITNSILPHFAAVYSKLTELGIYKVGIYGTRNACSRVSEAGYAITSFVSGMSTGFSGNLGYPLPKNWAFDQISTITLGSGEGLIEIDNNIKSGRDNGVSYVEQVSPSDSYDAIIKEALSNVGNDIPIFSGLAGNIVLDGEERTILDTNLLKVTYSSSKEVTQGDDDANIIYVIDGQPADNPFKASVLGRIQGMDGLSNEVQVGSEGMVNTLATNVGNGQIKTSISTEFGQIVYTYEIVVTDIELPFTTSASASIILKVYLKTYNFPPEYPVPVAVTERINQVSTEAFNGEWVATAIVGVVAVVGIGLLAVYASPVLAANFANIASYITAVTATILGI